MMLQKHAPTRAGKMLATALLIAAGFAGSMVFAQTRSQGSAGTYIAAVTRTPLEAEHLQRTYGRPVPGTVSKTMDGRIILSTVEQMPRFEGNMYKWLMANVRAPEKHIEGKVIVQFTIDASGKVSLPYIKQSSNNPRLDTEALRVVASMPAWKPGMQNGVAVPVLFTLPFFFGHLDEGC